MDIRIVDTTLRDGEQRSGIVLGLKEKLHIAKILDCLGIYQIEAGIPVMGGDEKKSVYKMMELGLKSKISAWNRMNIKDIKESIDCKPDIIHITIPSSDIHIQNKLCKDRKWVLDNMKKCVSYAKDHDFEVTIGLEDASRADFNFLLELIEEAHKMGVQRVRYADTVGVLYRQYVYNEIANIKKNIKPIEIEIHVHNDFGMAVSNSLSSVRAGAKYVDCTIGGIGERAGNCDLLKFVTSASELLGACKEYDTRNIVRAQYEVLRLMKRIA